jgi:hypothetical protein
MRFLDGKKRALLIKVFYAESAAHGLDMSSFPFDGVDGKYGIPRVQSISAH